MSALRSPTSRPLPPEAAHIVRALRRRQRPQIFGGGFVCSLQWDLGRAWPRFVIPRGRNPKDFDLRFVRGLELLVAYRPGHPIAHVGAVCTELRANGARVVVPLQTPRLVTVE